MNTRNLCHTNSSYSKRVCLVMTSRVRVGGLLAPSPGRFPLTAMSGSTASTARTFRTLSPCGFQEVLRDSQRPRSITTVRFQVSATAVASTCRANT